MGDAVRLEIEGGVGTLRLDRPRMNVIDSRLRTDLAEATAEVSAREEVRAVVLYGGEQVFAAGADIKEISTLSGAEMLTWGAQLQETLRAVAKIPKPVIAAIEGYALGGGCELALCADLRVVAENAKLGQPEILLGIIPGGGGTQRLARLVGPARAKDLCFTGRFVDAVEALSIGLADRVVPEGQTYAIAVEMASAYAQGPAVALHLAKQAIDDGLEVDLDTGLRLETALFASLFATQDQRTGMASFLAEGPGKARFVGH